MLLIILVAEISGGAWAYSKSDQLEELVRDTVTSTVRHEYGVIQSRTDTFDQIQTGVIHSINHYTPFEVKNSTVTP